ncbi:hypothetical protein CTAYLR_010185 [Chrysophaeum taylorii]|uniref:Sugar phosphate transporter domain-containing protein n=1 Tax=Chrysophaeum taylorii TaxID=2483200 RepID=A0AAD7U5T4_9STRA|nr:hypothetical protein CTAYLR_010185 [Chrysophaeum taylorii]
MGLRDNLMAWEQLMALVVCVPLWYLASAGSVIFLKEVLVVDENAVSGVVDATTAQLICGVVGGKLYEMLTDETSGSSETAAESEALVLASAFDVAGTAATNWVIIVGGASLSQVFKLMEPPITVVVSFLLLGELTSRPRLVFMAITCAGVYLSSSSAAAASEVTWRRHAVWLAGLVVMGTSFPLRNVYSKRMAVKGAPAYTAICVRGLALVLPVLVGRVAVMPTVSTHITTNLTLFVGMAVLSAVYNLLSFRVLSYVTPVTHAQLRLGKRIISLVVSIFALNDFTLSPKRILGLFAAFGGLVGYMFSPKAETPLKLPHHGVGEDDDDGKRVSFLAKDLLARGITYVTIAFLILGTNLTDPYYAVPYTTRRPTPMPADHRTPVRRLPFYNATTRHRTDGLFHDGTGRSTTALRMPRVAPNTDTLRF